LLRAGKPHGHGTGSGTEPARGNSSRQRKLPHQHFFVKKEWFSKYKNGEVHII